MSKPEVYQGERLDVMFDAPLCIHSRMCVLGRPNVFVPNADGPWIHPDNAIPEAIIEIAHSCPSGAISYRRKDGGTEEQPPMVNLIRIRENGPYAFHGELNIAGNRYSFRATLCRLRLAEQALLRWKPFQSWLRCLRRARHPQFRATWAPRWLANGHAGPLEVAGAMEIVSGTGRTIRRRNSAFLCRCGASANKPFCDGSHSKVSFTDTERRSP